MTGIFPLIGAICIGILLRQGLLNRRAGIKFRQNGALKWAIGSVLVTLGFFVLILIDHPHMG